MKFKDLIRNLIKNRDFIYFILGAFLALIFYIKGENVTKKYSKIEFEKWQLKVATATSNNIKLEQETCDATLRIINDKLDRIKNRDINNNELALEYLDNVKNEVATLKNIINNSQLSWDIMFPIYTKPEYADQINKVKVYDKELLNIIGDIKELDTKRKLEERSGETVGLKNTESQLQEKIKLYGKQLQSYKNLPTIYNSTVVSAGTLPTGSVILSNGNLFNPYRLQEKKENLSVPIKTDGQAKPPNNWGK